jgi:hypothetical protein
MSGGGSWESGGVAKLAHIEKCQGATAKLEKYLLNLAHPDGGPEARFVARFGFTANTVEELRIALIDHAEYNEIVEPRETEFGTTFTVSGPLSTPDGRDPIVRVIWMIDTGSDVPRLITLIPD